MKTAIKSILIVGIFYTSLLFGSSSAKLNRVTSILETNVDRGVVNLRSNLSQDEAEALTKLYQQTNGDNWNNNDSWNNTGYECSWYGVFCNSNRTHVTSIYLANNNLSGF